MSRKPRPPRRPAPNAPNDGRLDREATNGWRSAIAAAWLVGFVVYFTFASPELPNNPDLSRLAIWKHLPVYWLTFGADESPPGGPQSGWRFFPQRLDLLLVAGVILLAAGSLGRLVLRGLSGRPRHPADFGTPDRLERIVLAMGLGLSGLSLATLIFGLCGGLDRWVFAILLMGIVGIDAALAIRDRRRAKDTSGGVERTAATGRAAAGDSGRESAPVGLAWACGTAIAPFLLAMLLGAMIPERDFDVREYHLQGPKEHFLARRIGFLEHNVYTSFPFLTEMLSLLGMALRDDWHRGALAGKVVLMSFLPLTGMAVAAIARRIAGPAAGWVAALVVLSTPWTYRIAIIAYAEGGLTFYLAATALAAMIAVDASRTPSAARSSRGAEAGDMPRNNVDRLSAQGARSRTLGAFDATRLVLLSGLLAGSAMACKYPGVVSVVIPMGAAILWDARRSRSEIREGVDAVARRAGDWRSVLWAGAVYAVGVLVAVGPWLAKNLLETGNPVYPLLYSVFGGRDWDAAMNAKWKWAHTAHDERGVVFWITDVTARNDWLSPLLYGFAPLSLLAVNRRAVGRLWLYVAWLFLTWWLLTHRLDRFWVPMIAVVAALAGVGATAIAATWWKWLAGTVTAACVLFNLCVVTSRIGGPNEYLIDLDAARPVVAGSLIGYLNSNLPAGSKVLCVGEAQVFDAMVPLIYNTVFDRSIFQEWVGKPNGGPDHAWGLRDPEATRAKLHEEGITHVLVNWQEVIRYRVTYRHAGKPGYTGFVTPERFTQLQELGVLGAPVAVWRAEYSDRLGEPTRAELDGWGAALKATLGETAVWTTAALYPVMAGARDGAAAVPLAPKDDRP